MPYIHQISNLHSTSLKPALPVRRKSTNNKDQPQDIEQEREKLRKKMSIIYMGSEPKIEQHDEGMAHPLETVARK